ncbi:hypothetical protein OH77DRAFT_592707 [Trametes cingulata]|nr:hypothetical protein OH77DRAFT_592707 [Trametes cingulata]
MSPFLLSSTKGVATVVGAYHEVEALPPLLSLVESDHSTICAITPSYPELRPPERPTFGTSCASNLIASHRALTLLLLQRDVL